MFMLVMNMDSYFVSFREKGQQETSMANCYRRRFIKNYKIFIYLSGLKVKLPGPADEALGVDLISSMA